MIGGRKKMPKTPNAPLYQLSLKARVPASKLWKRDNPENRARTIQATAPDEAWQGGMAALFETLQLTDPNVIIGLMLNLVGPWPEEAKANLVLGIAKGLGMTLTEVKGEAAINVTQRFTPLPLQREDGTIER